MAKKKADGAEPTLDARGQLALELGGQKYVLRPSLEANLAIERKLRPLPALALSAEHNSLTLDEMGVIVAEWMRAYGKANPEDELATDYKGAKPERCAELIFEAGSVGVCMKLYIVLLGAITGAYDASGEAKASKGTKAE